LRFLPSGEWATQEAPSISETFAFDEIFRDKYGPK